MMLRVRLRTRTSPASERVAHSAWIRDEDGPREWRVRSVPGEWRMKTFDGIEGVMRGQVLACFHDEWEVVLDSGETVRASVRARHFADMPKEEKLLVAGDRVDVSESAGAHVIEERLPRETTLSRRLPGARREKEQVIVANADTFVGVASLGAPPLNRRLLDRYLVIAEDAELASTVVLNKTDLVEESEWAPVARAYRTAGYEVIPTSAVELTGVEELSAAIRGRFAVLAGPSGAGKSSLLNAIEPGLGLKVREVNRKTGKGKHTTTNVTIFRLDDGTLVADTPGFRELGLWRIRPEELDVLFPEFRELMEGCRYRGCNHIPEPGCAVREAVERGELDQERYESYVRLFEQLSAR
ncbi:MAG: ribosome small subunit-dependent GTPase A [Candidatus Eisenbacteria bacterium]|nr:ribosome small subunit-dependent GTPase A [Candidatus Eisenbacteria bacterium]